MEIEKKGSLPLHLDVLEGLREGGGVEAGHHDDLLPHVEPREGDDVQPEDVEHGQHADGGDLQGLRGEGQEVEPLPVDELPPVGDQVPVGQLHPLGRAGRPGGEGQGHGVDVEVEVLGLGQVQRGAAGQQAAVGEAADAGGVGRGVLLPVHHHDREALLLVVRCGGVRKKNKKHGRAFRKKNHNILRKGVGEAPRMRKITKPCGSAYNFRIKNIPAQKNTKFTYIAF